MSRIRGSRNVTTELRLIEIFRVERITGWRRNWRIMGKPDFVFPKHRLAVFVDGCFWHGCPIHGSQPKANAEFWQKKLERNKERDLEVGCVLRSEGWRVMRVWEHELTEKKRNRLLYRFRRYGILMS